MLSTPRSTPQKRPHVSGSGHTPFGKRTQTNCDTDGSVRRALSFINFRETRCKGPVKSSPVRLSAVSPSSPVKHHKWTEEEDKALIEFLDLSMLDEDIDENDNNYWPLKNARSSFWTEAARAIRKATRSNILLSTNRVRNRCRHWREKFNSSIEAAAKHFGLSVEDTISSTHANKGTVTRAVQADIHVPAAETVRATPPNCHEASTDNIEGALSKCKALSPTAFNTLLLKLMANIVQSPSVLTFGDQLFLSVAQAKNISTYPTNYFTKSISAMTILQENNKPNLMYKFAHILATNRPGTSTPLLPLDRMPFGLIQYQIDFFSVTNVQQIIVPPDFAIWLETMCAEFPTRFLRLFRGPGWSGSTQEIGNPLKARMNVAAPSLSSVYRMADRDKFDGSPKIQIGALQAFAKQKPGARVWFKADACDLKVALQTSMKGKWSGDVDLGDGNLEKLEADNKRRVGTIQESCKLSDSLQLERCIGTLAADIKADIAVLERGLAAANKKYEEKFRQPNSSTDLLKSLAWDRIEHNTLLEQAKSFLDRYERLLASLNPPSPDPGGVAQCLAGLRSDSEKYLNNLFKKKREPADHAMVIMMSDERRNKKPYAVPIQLVPYHSIRDQFLQQFMDDCHEEAKKLGLVPVGDVTDGEFNSLRTLGNKRPIHIYEIIREVKDSVRRTTSDTIIKSLRKVGEDENGIPIAELQEKSVPPEMIEEFHQLTAVEGMTEEDAIMRMRRQLVPPEYTPSTFRVNSPESHLDRLRSILSTCRFRCRVEELHAEGVPFKDSMYVPEKDGANYVHRREDHCHILKRLASHLRKDPPRWFNHHVLEDALHPQEGEPKSGLTEAALFGLRKQSVTDAEKLLSYSMATFLHHRGHLREANYIKVIAGWHEAADGSGLSEEERKEKNKSMMHLILEELMPWHRGTQDFKLMDINRFQQGVLGWSRETLIAVTTNIASMELRRRETEVIGYHEHPRAGTTDDVEAFFAGLHRHLGNTFTLKQLHERWPTEVREFSKRLDPDLPFFFWTINERYTEEPMPSFNDRPDNHPLRLHNLRSCRREDGSIFTSARGFLPIRNRGSIRQMLHRPEVPLPGAPPV